MDRPLISPTEMRALNYGSPVIPRSMLYQVDGALVSRSHVVDALHCPPLTSAPQHFGHPLSNMVNNAVLSPLSGTVIFRRFNNSNANNGLTATSASEVSSDESEVSDLSDNEEDDLEEESSRLPTKQQDLVKMENGWPINLACMVPYPTMLTIMRVFGPEQLDLWRKDLHKLDKQALVRAFKQWNPNFFTWFHRRRGLWVPVLGFKEESKRREMARSSLRKRSGNVQAKAVTT